jgi:transposase
MPRKCPFRIELSPAERAHLEATARKYTSPYRDVIRAKIVLYAAAGFDNDEIAARLDTPRQIVSKWRKRFFRERIAGLEERSRIGRPALFSPQSRGSR